MRYKHISNLIYSTRSSIPFRNSIRSQSSSVSISAGNNQLELTTGHLARFAPGAVVASQGDSAVLATCVFKRNLSVTPQQQGTALSVDYRQSAAALGKIPTNSLRRELGQSDADILASRIIDRSLRPLIPDEWVNDTQVICKPQAQDTEGDGVVLAINAAAAALHVSSIPFNGPLAAVRIAQCDGKAVINPPQSVLRTSPVDIVLSGCGDHRTVMIEMDGKEISLEQLEYLIDAGHESIKKILDGMNMLRKSVGKEKEKCKVDKAPNKLIEEVRSLAEQRLHYIFTDKSHDKISRDNAIKVVLTDVLSSVKPVDVPMTQYIFSNLSKQILRDLTLSTGVRCDGRSERDFRKITINVNVYDKLHGSALFQRGQTQVFSTVTFDSPASAFHADGISQLLGAQRKKMFMLHYEFPAYAVNEIQTARGVNRRELGHGALAEKALKHVVPADFPFCIRLASQVLESNGSSSMASACSGSLALYDAGVPLKSPVAGVAIGLITSENNGDEEYRVLTDILGIEDYAGDMDFKIAGTANGFTAIQLDVKILGLTRKQLKESLIRGKDGISHVLGVMAVISDKPRSEMKSSVPVMETIRFDMYKRAMLFRGGKIKAKTIQADTGVEIWPDDENHLTLFAPDKKSLEEAKEQIKRLVSDEDTHNFSFGQMIQAEITEILERGVLVRLQSGGRPVLVLNSQLHPTPIKHPSAIGLEVGQKITLQWLGRDTTTGAIRLSRKVLMSTNVPNRVR